MINENQTARPHTRYYAFWVISSLLFAIALALRWVRLDLMTFRYDQASVALRALDTFRSGLPLTGIVNSLGFHNGPGYIWTLLPAFLLNPDPRFATAWHGLIAATMVFPLALLGRRYRSDCVRYLPAILAAVLPAAVFSGRNLWAQYLLPPVACWSLLALDAALDRARSDKQRTRAAAICLTLLAWGISIHFSAAPLFLLALVALIIAFSSQIMRLMRILIPALVVFVTLIPSGFDWLSEIKNPSPKPDFAVAFESVLPDPLPWWVRVADSAEASVSNFSIEAVQGIQTYLSDFTLFAVKFYDLIILSIILISGVFALLLLVGRGRWRLQAGSKQFQTILLAWLLVPAALGGLFVQRVNAGYFLGSLPAAWLLPLALPPLRNLAAKTAWAVAGVLLVGGIGISALFLSVINQQGALPGGYYITYREQARVVQYMNEQGIGSGNFQHLAGDWFQRSYGYIQKHVIKPGQTDAVPALSQRFALMEDKLTIPGEERKIDFFWGRQPAEFGNVGILFFPSRGAAEIFMRDYYAQGNY